MTHDTNQVPLIGNLGSDPKFLGNGEHPGARFDLATNETFGSEQRDMPAVVIYTDGACRPNPGVGGWAALLISPPHPNQSRQISGAEASSTNNRMELTAALQALLALKVPCRVDLYTDSCYLRDPFENGWLASWKSRQWRTAARKPVRNADLWKQLSDVVSQHDVTWHWVEGHSGDEKNDLVDRLAVQAREELANRLGNTP